MTRSVLFLSEGDGWTAREAYTLTPANTYRLWTADIGDHVAAVLARADLGNRDDLELATSFAELVIPTFEHG